MSDNDHITMTITAAFGVGIVLTIFLFIGLSTSDPTPEPSEKIQKWYDLEEEVICYWVQPRYDTIALSCVRGKEWEE